MNDRPTKLVTPNGSSPIYSTKTMSRSSISRTDQNETVLERGRDGELTPAEGTSMIEEMYY